MLYAMVLKKVVIDIKESEYPPQYPPDAEGACVTAIPCSSTVKLGMIYEQDSDEFYEEKPLEPQLEPQPELTETEIIMQAMTDAELRDLEIQQGQEMLAQQMTDIELAVLGEVQV